MAKPDWQNQNYKKSNPVQKADAGTLAIGGLLAYGAKKAYDYFKNKKKKSSDEPKVDMSVKSATAKTQNKPTQKKPFKADTTSSRFKKAKDIKRASSDFDQANLKISKPKKETSDVAASKDNNVIKNTNKKPLTLSQYQNIVNNTSLNNKERKEALSGNKFVLKETDVKKIIRRANTDDSGNVKVGDINKISMKPKITTDPKSFQNTIKRFSNMSQSEIKKFVEQNARSSKKPETKDTSKNSQNKKTGMYENYPRDVEARLKKIDKEIAATQAGSKRYRTLRSEKKDLLKNFKNKSIAETMTP